jgi:pyruvate/2-oxoglutarate dehydrogenase complex dihydrolipoamide dehydrogenase (E3) component
MDRVENVDLLVVGGGKAGKTLAVDQAKAGHKVVMVERKMIGGSCINVACIPTKTLVTSARAARTLHRARDLGLVVDRGRVDLDGLRRHESGVVEGLVQANLKQFAESGMDFVLGTAHFVAKRTIEIELKDGGTRRVTGENVVINTGSRATVPDIPGLRSARPWTNNRLVQLPELPERFLVLGGGRIGCECAQMFAAFGSQVTVIDHGDRILVQEDEDVSDAVTEVFRRDGIVVRLKEDVESVQRDETKGDVHLQLVDGDELVANDILVAVGREPATDRLRLDAAGVETDDEGFIEVDEYLRTTAEHTWAAGDVARAPMFTHASLDDYRVIKSCLEGRPRSTRDRLIPYTIFTTPELARVGMTEAQARATGHNVSVATLPVAQIPRARTMRDTDGFWKAVVDAGTHRILGASLLGPETGEAITTVQTAMVAGMPYTALRDAIITHPTITEGLNLLFADTAFA